MQDEKELPDVIIIQNSSLSSKYADACVLLVNALLKTLTIPVSPKKEERSFSKLISQDDKVKV